MEKPSDTDIKKEVISSDERGEVKYISKPALKKPVSTDIYEKNPIWKDKNSGNPLRFLLKFLQILGCWLPILLVIVLIVFIIVKPEGLWRGFADYMNAGIVVPEIDKITFIEARDRVNSRITQIGLNSVEVTEPELSAIAQEVFPQLKDVVVDVEPELIKLTWVIDDTIEEDPIYGIVEVKKGEDDLLVINKFGTERLQTPPFLNKLITDSIIYIFKLQGDDIDNNIIYTLLNLGNSIRLTDVQLEQDYVILNITVTTGII